MYRREVLLLLACLLAVGCTQEPNPDPPIVVDRVVIDTFSPNNSATSDTILTLVDSDGTVLATDDDSSPQGWGYSRIDYTEGLPAGTYYIKVNHSDGSGTHYAIRVLDYVDDSFPVPGLLLEDDEPPYDDDAPGGIPTSPVFITIGDTGYLKRWLDPLADVDWFELVIIDNPITIGWDSTPPTSINQGDNVAITAQPTPSTPTTGYDYSYQWYCDGASLGASYQTAAITYGSLFIAGTTHTLNVIITEKLIASPYTIRTVSSNGFTFTVN